MDRLFLDLFEIESRMPEALRPSYRGAVSGFGLLLGLRGKLFLGATVTTLILLAGVGAGLRLLLVAVGLVIAAGAVGGAVSGLLEPWGRRGRPGELARWMVTFFMTLIVLSLLLPAVPFALPDPAFFWAAGAISVLGAVGMVLTDDRSTSRLPPHQFRLISGLVSLRAAPERLWRLACGRLAEYDKRRRALTADLDRRPEAREELTRLLLTMRTDLCHVHAGLERFIRLMGSDPGRLREAERWLDRIDDQLANVRAEG